MRVPESPKTYRVGMMWLTLTYFTKGFSLVRFLILSLLIFFVTCCSIVCMFVHRVILYIQQYFTEKCYDDGWNQSHEGKERKAAELTLYVVRNTKKIAIEHFMHVAEDMDRHPIRHHNAV